MRLTGRHVDELSDAADLDGLFAHVGRLDHELHLSLHRSSALHHVERHGAGRRRWRAGAEDPTGRVGESERGALVDDRLFRVISALVRHR